MTTKDQAIEPPYGSKREAAKAVYTPPFKFQRGYIFDSQQSMVADDDQVRGAVASRVRGWGKLSYLPNGAELQDEIGQMMADALNALYQPPAPDCRTCEYMWIDIDLEKATSKESCARFCGAVCINGSLHKPAPKVVLWRTE